jgi:hypothetical protein
MTREALSNAVKKARSDASLTQEAAAKAWGIPLSTLGAIEQSRERRDFGPTTLGHLDDVLGRSAWDLYKAPPEVDSADTGLMSLLEELRRRLEALEERVDSATRPLTAFEVLADSLAEHERAEAEAFMHWLISRRRGA